MWGVWEIEAKPRVKRRRVRPNEESRKSRLSDWQINPGQGGLGEQGLMIEGSRRRARALGCPCWG